MRRRDGRELSRGEQSIKGRVGDEKETAEGVPGAVKGRAGVWGVEAVAVGGRVMEDYH